MQERALAAYNDLLSKSITPGTRIDIVFTLVRIGFFYDDHVMVRSNIDKLKELVEQGGDWDRRNRLKAYEGVYLMSIRDFKSAARQFVDTLSTFTSTEMMSYQDFVKYAVLTSLISMQRVEIKKKASNKNKVCGKRERKEPLMLVGHRYWMHPKYWRLFRIFHILKTT